MNLQPVPRRVRHRLVTKILTGFTHPLAFPYGALRTHFVHTEYTQ